MTRDELSEANLYLYAAQHYYDPKRHYIDVDEFNEDMSRFKYIKRLLNRYLDSGKLSERLILNHLVVVFNVFGIEPTLKILEFKLEERYWPVLKPFLIFLKHIHNDQYTNISMDPKVVEALRKL